MRSTSAIVNDVDTNESYHEADWSPARRGYAPTYNRPMAPLRPAAVAGTWYPDHPARLVRELDTHLAHVDVEVDVPPYEHATSTIGAQW